MTDRDGTLDGEPGNVREAEEAQEEEETGEAQAPRSMKPPIKPSKDEVDEHMVSHLPFRAWCAHCVEVQVEGASQARL